MPDIGYPASIIDQIHYVWIDARHITYRLLQCKRSTENLFENSCFPQICLSSCRAPANSTVQVCIAIAIGDSIAGNSCDKDTVLIIGGIEADNISRLQISLARPVTRSSRMKAQPSSRIMP